MTNIKTKAMKKLIIPLMLLILITPSCKLFKKPSKKKMAAIEAQARLDSLRVADSLRIVEQRLLAKEQARLDSLRLIEEQKANKPKDKYNISVGSFQTLEFAESYAQEYKEIGYDPQIIDAANSAFHLVSAEAHSSFREAARRLEQFHDTVSIDAWLYVFE